MRILIIEDEAALAKTMANGLKGEGYEVDVEYTGLSGLWAARENHYDAIILDLLLPEMNGFKVCQTLRQDNNNVPILVLTAKQGEHDEAEALDTGADDFLRKPFSFVVLLARIRALVRRVQQPASSANFLEVGNLVIEPRSRKCILAGQEILLSGRELAVLELLAANEGQTFSKRELLDEVWGDDFLGDPNIVEVYVSYLRKKLDIPFSQISILTVRGIGYRLVVSS
ncbi:MAG: response regulator transcription factor [Firmicutes bacterium]|nr:response regulator transcription factor [Bacillota bacterium]